MKKFISVATCLFASAVAFSQITILQSDIPMMAGTNYWGRDTSSVITPGSAGANITWDYSLFVPANTDTSSGGDPFAFTPNPLFPTANFATTTNTSMLDLISYGFTDNSGIYGVGNDAIFNMQTYTAHSITFMTPMVIVYPFPFTYNNTETLNYVQEQITEFIPASPYDSVRTIYHRTRTINADGWGTLKTPYGTYNAIRLQRIEENVDTTFNHTTSGWVTGSHYSNVDTSYEWLTKNLGSVATIHRSGPKYTYRFYKTGTLSITEPPANLSTIFPNPVDDQLEVRFAAKVSNIRITNMTGQAVYVHLQPATLLKINTSNYNPGIYLLQATTDDGRVVSRKIVKQ